MTAPLPWELLLHAYANGYFPMAESRDSAQLRWFRPERRGILPLDGVHTPARLARSLRRGPFNLTTNRAFPAVIAACAAPHPTRPESWINPAIITLYTALWERGFAHSVECWEGEALAGGLYGVALQSAFFGESMFSRRTNASKAALLHLVALLRGAGYTLLDTQYVNPHLRQFGALEIPQETYMEKLHHALARTPAPCFAPPSGMADITGEMPDINPEPTHG